MKDIAMSAIFWSLAVPFGIGLGTAIIPYYAYVMVRRSWIYRKSWPVG